MNERQTIFSEDRVYRYTLWREWDIDLMTGCADDSLNHQSYVQFIGLNPSTADETLDDPTIRRCIGFSKAWGYGAMCMTNLFAFRATDPKVMKSVENPVGEDNQHHLLDISSKAGVVIAAWGNHGTYRCMDLTVKQWLGSIGVQLMCLRKSKDGNPVHPLYLPKDLKPIPL